MRRFFTLVVLLLFTIPFGVSIAGCSKGSTVTYCNGGDSGVPVGQVFAITLTPRIYGVSLNQGQIGSTPAPSATDCKGTKETVAHYTYQTVLPDGTPDTTLADVNPTTGQLCGGNWNRNSGGGIADYTTCNVTGKTGTAYVVASGSGVSSNKFPIFVHPVVTSVVLGPLATDCATDPSTNCSPAFVSTEGACTTLANGCCSTPITGNSASSATSCLSQGATGLLAAKVYTSSGQNISCQVGHLSFAAQTSSIVSIDDDFGTATAQQPGSTVLTATVANAGSSAGFFATCPPASIQLSIANGNGSSTANSVTIPPNNSQAINVAVQDTQGATITGLALTFESTTPTTIPASSGTITPTFPGAAAITAICQPPTCNPSPFNQIGLFGNGKPVASNPIQIISPGINSTKLFIGSTSSRYLVPVDFATTQIGNPVQLPYFPNSMVISNDGNSIYMGSQFALMTFSATTNTLTAQDTTMTGNVLALSPDGSTLVISDPLRQIVYLYNTKNAAVTTQYGGVGTHAQFTPDSTTVYITLGDYNASTGVTTPNSNLLVHSSFTGWFATTSAQSATDVAVTVPAVGAFLGGPVTTARSYCPVTTTTAAPEVGNSTTTNVFFPSAGVAGPTTDRIAVTNDGVHVLGATVTPAPTLVDLSLGSGLPKGECPQADGVPQTFSATPIFSGALPGVTATAITGIDPTSDSKIAFVTYTGTGGVLPTYTPQATGAGALGSIALSTAVGTPVAPLAGVVSADDQTFYTGTSGDNAVHLITRQTDGTYKDTTTPITPKLQDGSGNIVAPNLLVQKPRPATS